MKKFIVTIFLFLLSANAYAQNCIVFGKITDQSGTAIKGSKVTIRDVRKDGNLIDLGPRNYFTNSGGWFYIPVVQGATAKLYANVAGFNTPGGVTISIPALDSVNIDTLQTIVAVSTAGLTVKKNEISLTGKYGILDFQKQFMLWTDNSQEVNIKIKPYVVGYNAEDTTSLAVAIDAAAADTAMVIVASRQNIAETEPDTLPATATLWVRNGGRINITRRFRIEGHFVDPGPIQVFEGNLDSLEFAPGSVDYVRPEWFGAKADGLSNSTLSINYAIKSISGSGIPILLDSGIYLVDSIRVNIEQIENNNINFGISGISGNTVISPYLTPSDTFIVIGDNSQVSSRSGRRINITNIRIQGQRGWNDTTKVNSIALWLDQLQDVEMRNVFISSFAGGLALYDIWDSNFYDIQIMHCGVDSVRPALLLKTATNNSNALRFFGLHIEHARNAIYIDRNNRHIYFIGGKFEFSDLTSISQPSYPYIIIHENANEVSFIGNQFVVGRQPNTSEPYAIEVRNSYTKFIGNDFTTNYPSIIGAKWIDASKADPIKITSNTFDYAWGGQYSIKLGNNAIFSNNDVFVDSTSGARYGIWMNSENKVVYNNIKGLPDTGTLNAGIMFFAAGTGNIIEANRVYGVVDTMYYATDFGNNFFAPIFDDQFSILDVNSQTPDVSLNNNYITANTIATNITNFSNSSEGKRLTIHFGDANTVVKNGSTIKLSNGVDFVPRVGDVLYLENRGGVWYEIGRNPLLAINTQTKFFEFKVIADTLCAISGADTTRLVPSR